MNQTNGSVLTEDEELIKQYIDWTSDALRQMHAHNRTLQESQGKDRDAVHELHNISHNIKGMGTSFDFMLMTQVGELLCNYLKPLSEGDIAHFEVIQAHIDCFEKILTQRIVGDGGDAGKNMIDELQSLIAGQV